MVRINLLRSEQGTDVGVGHHYRECLVICLRKVGRVLLNGLTQSTGLVPVQCHDQEENGPVEVDVLYPVVTTQTLSTTK
jgi:hypothetical protein